MVVTPDDCGIMRTRRLNTCEPSGCRLGGSGLKHFLHMDRSVVLFEFL